MKPVNEADQVGTPVSYLPWWADVAGHLGGVYPFQDLRAPAELSLNVGAIIDARRARGERIQLDPVGLVTKAAFPYLLGNRTLLEGVRRAPWMAQPDAGGVWHHFALPPHGLERPDPDRFVRVLRDALLEEASRYLIGAKTVGVLLSGGMDSRIAAGVVRALQLASDNAFSVVGLTWGCAGSRDVVYARKIADRLGWPWQHYPISAYTLDQNIRHAAYMGAEVSPLHLHAIPDIATADGLDAIIAGSYGDSVGRAEFSGRRLTKLKPILGRRIDRFGVLRAELVSAVEPELRADAIDSPHLNAQTSTLRRLEIEQEMNYMRRMLQACMLEIARERRFYQIFTSPDVFARMWALDPAIRDDAWYTRLLPLLPGNLLDIPWARTGRRYEQPDDQPDTYPQQYHAYGIWLRRELRESVLERVKSERIRGLGIFNEQGLENALKAWAKAKTASTNSLDELFGWIASLDEFLMHYQIGADDPALPLCWRDKFNSLRGGLLARAYVEARGLMRD